MNEKKNFNEIVNEMERGLRKSDYHMQQYQNYNRIVKTTKGRKGLFKIIHDIAVKRSFDHWTKGMDLILNGITKYSDLLNELRK